MLKKLALLGLILSISTAIPVYSQSSSTSQEEMPAVQQPDDGKGENGLMSGEKPFTLMVDENVGELIYTFDEDTKELESIKAKRGVIFASEDMTLNSDDMEYTTLNSKIIATGKRVVVRMGDMVITCQVFNYNPQTQEGLFEGGPIVYQKDKEGKVTTTGGRVISVNNVNGKLQMRVGSGGGTSTYIKQSGKQGPNAELEKKTLGPGEQPAVITLNNKPSGLTVSPGASGSTKSSSGSLLPVPSVSSSRDESNGAAPSTSVKNSKINPDNPDDIKKLSE